MPMLGLLLLIGIPVAACVGAVIGDICKIVYICIHWREFK
jgi:hypothetical protein